MWCCDNVGGLGEHVTCHLFGFLVYLFCVIFRLAPSAHQWTDFDDLYVTRRVSAQRCAFGDRVNITPYFGVKFPKPPFWVHE